MGAWKHRLDIHDEDTVTCSHCGVIEPLFRTRKGVRKAVCPTARQQQRNSPRRRVYSYGLTPLERVSYLNGRSCEICGTTNKLVVDHCHDTGIIRGSLCTTCNSGIGMFHDSVDKLTRAAKYLSRKTC
jgi:hypothetical protein